MKKLIVLCLTLISLIASGKEPQGLFGLYIGDSVLNHITKAELAEKVKTNEAKGDYYDIFVTNRVHNKSPFFNDYWVTIDKNNKIHSITGTSNIVNLDVCLSQINTVEGIILEAYDISFISSESTYSSTTFHSKTYEGINYLELNCRLDNVNNNVTSMLFLDSKQLVDMRNEYYNSGI